MWPARVRRSRRNYTHKEKRVMEYLLLIYDDEEWLAAEAEKPNKSNSPKKRVSS
jgi:hypothetical protein